MDQMSMDRRVGQAVDELQAANRGHSLSSLVAYATAWVEYEDADINIREHGTIVFHPKTGAPIPNPYLAIRDSAERRMEKVRGVKGDVLWARRSGA